MAIGKSKLHEMLRRARRISDVVFWYETFSSAKTRDEIIDWIRIEQLNKKGVNADDEVIGLYSYASELISNGVKQEGTPYTLEDTGQFYRSMYMVILKDAIVFEADPIKGNDNLFEKYGSNIINLNKSNKEKLRILVKDKYIGQLKEILYGT